MNQLENAVNRLLQHNAQLQDICADLIVEKKKWQQEKHDMLVEVESLLADLEMLQEQQS